jgi:hypothetical protein
MAQQTFDSSCVGKTDLAQLLDGARDRASANVHRLADGRANVTASETQRLFKHLVMQRDGHALERVLDGVIERRPCRTDVHVACMFASTICSCGDNRERCRSRTSAVEISVNLLDRVARTSTAISLSVGLRP